MWRGSGSLFWETVKDVDEECMLMLIGIGPVVEQPPGSPIDDNVMRLARLDWRPSAESIPAGLEIITRYNAGCGSLSHKEVSRVKKPTRSLRWATTPDGTELKVLILIDPVVMMAKQIGRGGTLRLCDILLEDIRDTIWMDPTGKLDPERSSESEKHASECSARHNPLWPERHFPFVRWVLLGGHFMPRPLVLSAKGKLSRASSPRICTAILLKVCTGHLWAAHPQLNSAYSGLKVPANLEVYLLGFQHAHMQQDQQQRQQRQLQQQQREGNAQQQGQAQQPHEGEQQGLVLPPQQHEGYQRHKRREQHQQGQVVRRLWQFGRGTPAAARATASAHGVGAGADAS